MVEIVEVKLSNFPDFSRRIFLKRYLALGDSVYLTDMRRNYDEEKGDT